MTKYNNKKTVINNILLIAKIKYYIIKEYGDRLIELLNQKYGV